MPTEETLITVLLIALAANLGLMVLVILAAWIRGRRRRVDDSAPIMATSPGLDAARDSARAAAAAIHPPLGNSATRMDSRPVTTSFAATEQGPWMRASEQLPEGSEGPALPTNETATDMRGDFATRESVGSEPSVAASMDHGAAEAGPTARSAGFESGALVDPRTGLDSPRAWSRSLSEEMARIARYRRPASIVLIEVEGLERLVDRFGAEAGDRLLPVISDTIRKNARAADHVAALEAGRYGILLTETDEIRAINFIERVRTACDAWLAAGAVTLRLAIGWADANAGRTLEDAVATAEERLNADRRRPFPEPDFRTSSLEG